MANPVIKAQPQPTTVASGDTATFQLDAATEAGLSAAWQVSADNGATWTAIASNVGSSATSTDTYFDVGIGNVTGGQDGQLYQCVVSNGSGSTTSQSVRLTVSATPPPPYSTSPSPNPAPIIVGPPGDLRVAPGVTAEFRIDLQAEANLSAIWQVSVDNGVTWAAITTNLESGYGDPLTSFFSVGIGNLAEAASGNLYRAVVSNSNGPATSRLARLLVVNPKLKWSPPALTSPITIQLPDTGSHYAVKDGGSTGNALDNTKDYILVLPNVPLRGGIDINGGRNVVIIGGEIDLAPDTTDSVHGINISTGSSGEVFIEGVLIKNPDPTHSGYTGDGIDVNSATLARLTLQNLRIEGIDGGNQAPYPDAHADILQPYGMAGAIRVDRLTGSTTYQGMQISPDLRKPTSGDYRNVNIKILPNTHGSGSGNKYGWWIAQQSPAGNTYPMTLTDCYVEEPNPGTPGTPTSGGNCVWPDTNFSYPAVYANGKWTWPSLPLIAGGIYNAPPVGGDFVPPGVAGIGYVSPGYQ